MSRGFGNLTYEKFSGDLSDVNYSSIRAGNLNYQRVVGMIVNTRARPPVLPHGGPGVAERGGPELL